MKRPETNQQMVRAFKQPTRERMENKQQTERHGKQLTNGTPEKQLHGKQPSNGRPGKKPFNGTP